ncbi:MAG: hypothetical protein B6U72_00595 [Candidatus Altiarchaeales archaeon ex4484_2]|nr:MAG: hypothetical protein B6U72_00595 [Candidatus Altiarchaeales archaeon ex4484_2]
MKPKHLLITALALTVFIATTCYATSVKLDDMGVEFHSNGDDSLDIDVGDGFQLDIILTPDENESDVDIKVDVYFDDILVLDGYKEDNVDLEEGVDYTISLDEGDFDSIWDNLFLGYDCGDHEIEVKVYDDVDDEQDTVDLEIEGDEFNTVTITPESPGVDEEITVYVEDEDGDEMDRAYIKIFHLGDDETWDEDDEDTYERTEYDGEATFTLEDEFDPAIGRYLFIVVESSGGGSYCRETTELSLKKELVIGELPQEIRAGEVMELKILDPNDNPVPYADVTVSGQGFSETKSTDGNGYVYFTIEETGGYSILATKTDFDDSLIKHFTVKPRSDMNIEVGPDDALVGEQLTVTVSSSGEAVESAEVRIKKPDGIFESTRRTSSSGVITYIPQAVGVYEIEVSKESYETAVKKHVVSDEFQVQLEGSVLINENIPITVKDHKGNAVKDAIVSIRGVKIAQTDSLGKASFVIESSGTYTVGVSKEGFKEFSREITAEGSLKVELSKSEIGLDETVTITVKDMRDQAIEAEITIDEPDRGSTMETASEFTFAPETAGKHEVRVNRRGYSPCTTEFTVEPYQVKLSSEVSGNYLIVIAKRNNEPVSNLTVSVTPPSSDELFMYTDRNGIARMDLEQLGEKGNFTITLDETNYESDIIVKEITGWGGVDLVGLIMWVLIAFIVILAAAIAFVYLKGKDKLPAKKVGKVPDRRMPGKREGKTRLGKV